MQPESQQPAIPATDAGQPKIPHQFDVPDVAEMAATSGEGADFFAPSSEAEIATRRPEIRRRGEPAWRKKNLEPDHLESEDYSYSRPQLRLVEDEPVAAEPEKKLTKKDQAKFKRLVRPRKVQPCHFGLLVCTLILTAISIPLIYSASAPIAIDQHKGDANFFLFRQALYVAIGLAVMIGVSRIPTEKLRGVAWGLFGASVVGLLLTKFGPLGYTMGNTERWVKLGPITIQFSEVAKIALIGVMADYWSRARKDKKSSPWTIWGGAAALAMIPIGLVMLQPHLSAALVLMLIPLAVAFYSGVPVRQIGSIVGTAAIVGLLTISLCKTGKMPILKPYQQERIAAFLGGDSKEDARGSDYQSLQGQRALMKGGLLGMGPGASFFKNGYLPAPHTDFVFAVTGEEWGLVGSVLLLFLFASLMFYCLQIAHGTKDPFEQLLCAGVGTLIGVQTLGNVAVVSGMFPVTGMPLPIITFGGSALWCTLGGLGLVLAVSRSLNEDELEA